MVNRINNIRKQISTLRASMLETEAIMRNQINRDQECSFVAEELIKMRAIMVQLVEERRRLGDREPIHVAFALAPHKPPAPQSPKIVKRHLKSCVA